jgi:predicted acetyltransferase
MSVRQFTKTAYVDKMPDFLTKGLRKMELRKINKIDAKAQWEYTTALPTDENGLTNPYNGVSYDDYINKVLPTLISYEHPVNMPDWFVPETYYYLWDEGHLVGEFRIRHHLTEALKSGAGHIGYSIKREERGKGYATAGLKLTLLEARKIIPEDEIYLRVNRDNIASQKVMLKNGGRIVGEDEGHFFVRIPKYPDCGMEKSN